MRNQRARLEAGEKSPWLFENLLGYNRSRESEGRGGFFIFLGRNPLKSPDSEKQEKIKESKFTSV
jgi:hypothetical protein